ncbi:transporter substrate-binding domain-containing protein [Arthrobacter gandavensis]|nr:transporter substrate-binding domain-containing protein [Arthrobacter gandavensis]
MLRSVPATVALLAVVGCVGHFPADPDQTLTDVTGGTLRVGASVNPPYVEDQGRHLSGSEVELVEHYAQTLDANIEWTQGGEEDLMGRLEHGELDLVIGGLTDKTPWTKKAGLTRPYTESTDAFGSRHKHVLAVPLGENAFLLDLDTYLQERRQARQ